MGVGQRRSRKIVKEARDRLVHDIGLGELKARRIRAIPGRIFIRNVLGTEQDYRPGSNRVWRTGGDRDQASSGGTAKRRLGDPNTTKTAELVAFVVAIHLRHFLPNSNGLAETLDSRASCPCNRY